MLQYIYRLNKFFGVYRVSFSDYGQLIFQPLLRKVINAYPVAQTLFNKCIVNNFRNSKGLRFIIRNNWFVNRDF